MPLSQKFWKKSFQQIFFNILLVLLQGSRCIILLILQHLVTAKQSQTDFEKSTLRFWTDYLFKIYVVELFNELLLLFL